jgi:CRISPR-associated endonuclease Cas2
MTRKKKQPKPPLTFVEIMQKLKDAGISESNKMVKQASQGEFNDIPDLNERVKQIIGIINNSSRPITNMLFFVMYDIESDKVRTQVSKYLIREGCTRIQRSIFLADLTADTYNMIRNDLTEVQSLYENHDSIIIVPISTDYLKAMRVIGQAIDVDIITKSKNTLFF